MHSCEHPKGCSLGLHSTVSTRPANPMIPMPAPALSPPVHLLAARPVDMLGCAVVLIASSGCSTLSRNDAEKYIKDSESQWAESVATNDASVLRRILADDLVWVYPDGHRILWTKAQAIADAESGPGPFISDHVDDVHVRFFGHTAVSQGSESWVQRQKDGTISKGRFVWTDVWVLRHGQWQIVQAQDDEIGPAGPGG
jgi:ketosteroid isomerase-like protein